MSVLSQTIPFFFKSLSTLAPESAARLATQLLFRARWMHSNKKTHQDSLVTFKSGCVGRFLGESGKIVVLVHGWQSSGQTYSVLTSTLLEKGFRVLLWDGPGHGNSPGKSTHLPDFSRALYSDLKEFSDDYYALVGHSFGAAACALVCRMGIPTKKLVFISGPSSAIGVFQRFWNLIKLSPKAQEIFVEIVETNTQMTLDEMSFETFVADLKQEILIVHDHKDKLIPVEDALELFKRNNTINLHLTEGLGHHRILKSDQLINKISQFMEASSGAID